MKLLIVFILIIISIAAKAQTNQLRHIEIGVSSLFWTPTAEHMKANNSLLDASIPNGYYDPFPNSAGYGQGVAPAMHVCYYFKNYLGAYLGFNYLSLTNHLEYPTKTYLMTGDLNVFHNEAQIINLKIGYAGQTKRESRVNMFFGAGLNYIPSYSMNLNTETNFFEQPTYEAKGNSFGFYVNSGLKIQLIKSISLNIGIEYTNNIKTLKYIGAPHSGFEKKTNLGGIAGQIGLSFNFGKDKS
ncbi:MAG: outer membrane beta-barrel protein [Bacteroidales bacterium]|nr:outer membrane beta-barrel protein [Bacteroidales bacterium]